MTQQQGIVKGGALQKIGSAGFIIGAALMVMTGLLMPINDLGRYGSHPDA